MQWQAMTDGATLYLQEDSSERIDVPDGSALENSYWRLYIFWMVRMGDESEIEVLMVICKQVFNSKQSFHI